jgi:hypothetical protein
MPWLPHGESGVLSGHSYGRSRELACGIVNPQFVTANQEVRNLGRFTTEFANCGPAPERKRSDAIEDWPSDPFKLNDSTIGLLEIQVSYALAISDSFLLSSLPDVSDSFETEHKRFTF